MDLLYRFIIFIMAILFMFASLLIAIYSFGLAEANMLPDLLRSFYNQWELGVLFLFGFIAGSWIIYPFFIKEKSTTMINRSDLGEVDITLDALDNLVNTVALQQEGVVDIKNRLRATEGGLSIFLSGKVIPRVPIPELTENLQLLVKSYIEDTTGVNVKEVRVLVEDIGDEKKKSTE